MSIKYHSRKAYGGFEAYFQTFLASALNAAKQLDPLNCLRRSRSPYILE
jgi:hypothetical protein